MTVFSVEFLVLFLAVAGFVGTAIFLPNKPR